MRVATSRIALCAASHTLLLLLAGCSSGDGYSPSPSPPTPTPTPVDTTPPTVPTGLTATAQSTTQIALSWTASTDAGTGIGGYRVFRNAGATPIATVMTTAYTDTNLTAATTYTYTVRAYDAATPANESGDSAAASATTNTNPPVSGLDARPSNTTCLAGDPPSNTVSIAAPRVFTQLGFFSSVAMLQAPRNSTRWYVVEKGGTVRVFENTPNVSTSSLFIDITSRLFSSAGEMGLLGMAFHPNYPTDPRVFLF